MTLENGIFTPALISHLQEGDPEAWRQVLEHCDTQLRSDIFVSLIKRGLSDESLEDIAQETWITAAQNIDHFVWQGPDAFYHWLRVISLNHIRKRVSQLKKHKLPVLIDRLQIESNSSWSFSHFLKVHGLVEEDIEKKLELQNQQAAIMKAVAQLTNAKHREIVLLALVDGKKPRELATQYHMKADTVSQIIWRVKNTIRQLEELADG